MLCENCQKNEANCYIHIIEDGVTQSKNLCTECHEASSPEARQVAAAQRDARCEYCDGQPCGGGTDTFAMMTGIQKLKFMCMSCSMEYHGFRQQQLRQDVAERVSELPWQEQIEFLRILEDGVNKHMKQWVSERGSQ